MKKIFIFSFIALFTLLLAGCHEDGGDGEVYTEEYYILEGKILDIEEDIERIRNFLDHVRNNNIDGVIAALEGGLDAEIAHFEEGTALIIAAAYGYEEMVVLLLNEYAANINAETEAGLTALMMAAEQGHTDIAELLIYAGAYVDGLSDDGKTALMMAVENGEAEVAALLARWTLYLNALDIEGRTAEALARLYGRLDILEMLIEERLERLKEHF